MCAAAAAAAAVCVRACSSMLASGLMLTCFLFAQRRWTGKAIVNGVLGHYTWGQLEVLQSCTGCAHAGQSAAPLAHFCNAPRCR
eukprot:155319-Pelagomonas_calceolata.AAC.6